MLDDVRFDFDVEVPKLTSYQISSSVLCIVNTPLFLCYLISDAHEWINEIPTVSVVTFDHMSNICTCVNCESTYTYTYIYINIDVSTTTRHEHMN